MFFSPHQLLSEEANGKIYEGERKKEKKVKKERKKGRMEGRNKEKGKKLAARGSGSILLYLFKIWVPQPNTLSFLCSTGGSDELETHLLVLAALTNPFFVGYFVVILDTDIHFKLYLNGFGLHLK